MQVFSIRDVERMSGIKAHTLRVWESRYGLALPQRKESKHRFYTNEDLRSILRISWLYRQGYKISFIASLSDESIAEMIEKEVRSGVFFTEQMAEMLKASRHLDDDLFERIMANTILQLGIERAMVHVFYPVLEKIGYRWMSGDFIPAQEHFATSLIRNMLIRQLDDLALPQPNGRLPILLFTPEEEYHELPLLFIYYLLRKNGYPTIYLGANVSDQVVEEVCRNRPVVQIHYHQLTNFTNYDAQEYLEMWCDKFPQKQVVASGPLTSQMPELPPNAHAVRSMNELLLYCRQPYPYAKD
jgi:DNA-binding transcriptional MerR regulator